MKKTVVILLSDKRSGSTALQDELCRHPEVQHVAYSPHTYYETHHWLKAACLLRRPASLFDGGARYRGYGSLAGTRRYIVDTVRGNVPDFVDPGDNQQLIEQGWDALCEGFANPVFFEKSPQLLAHWAALDLLLAWSEKTSCTVRFVGLVRNPMAVMYSAFERFGTPPDDRQFGWARCYRNLLAFQSCVPPECFYRVCYEDLIADPIATRNRLFEFMGVGDHDVDTELHADSITKWKTDPTFTLRLDDSVKRLALHLGYKSDDLENPNGSEVPCVSPRSRGLFCSRLYDRWLHPLMLKTLWRK